MADSLEDQLDYAFEPDSNVDETLDSETFFSDEQEEKHMEPLRKKTKTDRSKLSSKRHQRMLQAVEQKQKLGTTPKSNIADVIASKITQQNSHLSLIEINEQSVPEAQIMDTSAYRVDRDLDGLGSFLKEFNLLKPASKPQSFVVVLCVSAVRVCDIARVLKPHQLAAKLISKNKTSYDIRALQETNLAIATPGRLQKLLNKEILSPSSIEAIVGEMSFLDVKTNSILDLEDTIPLLSSLTRSGSKLYIY